MNFKEYASQIDDWTARVNSAGIRMSDGRDVPRTFWKTFLGIKRRVHQGLYSETHNVKSQTVMPYVTRAIELANLLPEDVFLREVRRLLPAFEEDKES